MSERWQCSNCGGVFDHLGIRSMTEYGWYLCQPCTPRLFTEADVRRIVREELAKQPDPLTLRTIGGKP